jgi:hypothetical protein
MNTQIRGFFDTRMLESEDAIIAFVPGLMLGVVCGVELECSVRRTGSLVGSVARQNQSILTPSTCPLPPKTFFCDCEIDPSSTCTEKDCLLISFLIHCVDKSALAKEGGNDTGFELHFIILWLSQPILMSTGN